MGLNKEQFDVSNERTRFSGQCILITGGTTLAGRTCACLLAAQGALVLISGEDHLLLESTLQSIREQVSGCSVIGLVADLTTDEGIGSFFLHARMAFPKVDAVIIIPASTWATCAVGSAAVYMACMRKAAAVIGSGNQGNIINMGNKHTRADLTTLIEKNFCATAENNCLEVSLIMGVNTRYDRRSANVNYGINTNHIAIAVSYSLNAPRTCQIMRVKAQ